MILKKTPARLRTLSSSMESARTAKGKTLYSMSKPENARNVQQAHTSQKFLTPANKLKEIIAQVVGMSHLMGSAFAEPIILTGMEQTVLFAIFHTILISMASNVNHVLPGTSITAQNAILPTVLPHIPSIF